MKQTRLNLLSLAAMLLFTTTIVAAPRTKEQMKAIAASAINSNRVGGPHRAPRSADAIVELQSNDALSVLGYTDGGFAVVAADDRFDGLLGVSATAYRTNPNPNFQWWLTTMTDVLRSAAQNNTPLQVVAPDPTKYPVMLGPLVESKWDQDEPYDRMTPMYNSNTHCLTGCVATAMAQVLYYHQIPEHGYGQRTIYYNGQAVTSNFATTYWDWDNMLPIYKHGEYNDTQANAVAQLMHDCGVASNMMYGGPNEGSGTYSNEALKGLRQYFGLEGAVLYERDDYNANEWMDIVYTELNDNGPVYYAGISGWDGGHAFVIDGYDETGMVSVNWGWSGDEDGLYDIAKLNPAYYQFSMGQEMIGGIQGKPRIMLADTITTTAAGQLNDLLPDSLIGKLGILKVSGPLNGSDILRLRQLAGTDIYGDVTKGRLRELDLTDATIVSGGAAYFIPNGRVLHTVDDELPTLAFYNCKSLSTIKLPKSIKTFGDGALARCAGLTDIYLPQGSGRDFIIADNVVWNTDQTEIICVLPTVRGVLDIPAYATRLHDYAMAGCSRLTHVVLPEQLTRIGREAFYGCSGMSELRVRATSVPALDGANVFEGVHFSECKLIVRSGMKDKFKTAAQWKDFPSAQVVEAGTAVKAKNASRKYGDKNPTFSYTVIGNSIQGSPTLTCQAKVDSPSGRYTIKVNRGSVVGDDIDFIDGYLVVKKAPLTVKSRSYSRYVGQPNPEFQLSYSGFKNDDTPESALTQLPVGVTDATEESPAGTYTIRIQGGESDCYTFNYVSGTLVVKENPAAIVDVNATTTGNAPVYNLNGVRIDSSQQLGKGIYIRNGRKHVVR